MPELQETPTPPQIPVTVTVRRPDAMLPTKKPRRRWTVEINVQADTWEWAVRELERLAAHVVEHGPQCDSVSGSPDVGSWVHIIETPGQTHEQYFEELNTYLERVRAAEGAGEVADG